MLPKLHTGVRFPVPAPILSSKSVNGFVMSFADSVLLDVLMKRLVGAVRRCGWQPSSVARSSVFLHPSDPVLEDFVPLHITVDNLFDPILRPAQYLGDLSQGQMRQEEPCSGGTSKVVKPQSLVPQPSYLDQLPPRRPESSHAVGPLAAKC
jgi:hypothetical protein